MRRIIIVVLTLICMLGVTACMNEEMNQFVDDMKNVIEDNTKASVSNAQELLSQKYGMSFEADKIGNRLDTGTADLLMHPVSQPELFFKATVNNEEMTCNDNLMRRIISAKLSRELCDELSDKGVKAYATLRMMSDDDTSETDTEISVEDYFEKYNVTVVTVYMIADGEADETTETLLKASCDGMKQRHGVKVALRCCFISRDYHACEEEMKKNADINSSWFDSYSVTSELEYAAV